MRLISRKVPILNNINQGLVVTSGIVNQAIVEKAIMAAHDW